MSEERVYPINDPNKPFPMTFNESWERFERMLLPGLLKKFKINIHCLTDKQFILINGFWTGFYWMECLCMEGYNCAGKIDDVGDYCGQRLEAKANRMRHSNMQRGKRK